MTWPTVKLGDICEIYAGGGAPQLEGDFCNDGIPFIRAGSLPKLLNGIQECQLEKINTLTATQYRLKLYKKDAIVFAKSGMSATKGHIYRLKNSCYIVNHLAILKPLDACCPNYLEYALKKYSPTSLILDPAYPSIRLSDIANFKLPLPPLAEQQRIAAILDKAELVKRKRELVIEKLDKLAQSVFNKMFGADIKNSKSKVADFFVINDNKLNIRMNDEELIPFVPMAAVSEITKSVFDIQFRNFKEVKKGYTPIKKGDLIIAKITPCYENGKMALINEITNDFAFGSTEFHTIRASNLNYLYLLFYYLDSEVIRKGGALNMKGAAGQRRVPAEYFSSLPFCIPIEEQITKFIKIINKIKYERKIHCDSLDSICSLQHSLQSKAFSGQL